MIYLKILNGLLRAARANPAALWAPAFTEMWATYNELIEKEWPIRLLRAGLQVPSSEADWGFRGAFFGPMMSTFLDLIDRHGLEQACVLMEKMLPQCIGDTPVDEKFLRWVLANPTNSETVRKESA